MGLTAKRLYTVINKEEPRGQSVALEGIPVLQGTVLVS